MPVEWIAVGVAAVAIIIMFGGGAWLMKIARGRDKTTRA